MKNFKAFTLTELMVAIAVIGILCAIVLPGLLNNNPNQNRMMMKKAYTVFLDITHDLINDSENYPVIYGLCPDNGDGGYIGFDCAEADSKFPYLFSKRLSTKNERIPDENTIKTDATYSKSGNANCNGVGSSCYYLTTDDNMSWAFEKSALTKGSYTDSILIGVDVNGSKKPNCYEGSNSDNCKNRSDNFDQFRMKLYANGTVKIHSDDKWAMESIQVNSSLTE